MLDTIGDSEKTRYIYDVLSQVNQKIAINSDKDYFKKLKEKEEQQQAIFKYKAGKLIIDSENKSKKDEFIENFATCANQKAFLGDEE